MKTTHTFATLEISGAAYDEIAGKLRDVGYDHAFIEGAIDMNGIGLVRVGHLEVTCGSCGTVQTTNDPEKGRCRIQRCGAPLRYKPAPKR